MKDQDYEDEGGWLVGKEERGLEEEVKVKEEGVIWCLCGRIVSVVDAKENKHFFLTSFSRVSY